MNAHGITISRIIPLEVESLGQTADHLEEVDSELLPFFEEEASAELKEIEKLLQAWDGEVREVPLRELRRRFHTLKGTANSIGLVRIGALASGMEDLFARLNLAEGRSLIIKTCVAVLQAIRSLMQEAHQPRFSPARKEQIIGAAALIIALKERGREWKGAA
jgi:chemotaxis protein histidine kinase CheA